MSVGQEPRIPVKPGIWKQKAGAGWVWGVRFKGPNGRGVFKSCGEGSKMADAMRLLTELRSKAQDGQLPDRSMLTVDRAWQRFLAELQQERSASTHHAYDAARKRFQPILGDSKVQKLSASEVVEARDRLLSQGMAPKTVKEYVNALRRLLNWCKDRELIYRNPCDRVGAVKVPVHETAVLTPAQVVTLQEYLLEQGTPEARLLVALSVVPIRLNEMRPLRWQDVKLEDEQPRFWLGRSFDRNNTIQTERSNKLHPRWCYLSPLAVRVFAIQLQTQDWHNRREPDRPRALNQSGLVWIQNNEQRLSCTEIRRQLGRATKALGLPGISPHGLRHTWASNQLAAGTDVVEVAAALGDSPEMVLRRYAHVIPGRGAAVAARTDAIYAKEAVG